MITITGCKLKNGGFKMHSPAFPYTPTVYLGYTEAEMKRKYRRDFNLVGRHIDWVIL